MVIRVHPKPREGSDIGCSDSHPRTPPRPQILEMAPPKPSALLAAIVVLTTSNGYNIRVSIRRSFSLSPLSIGGIYLSQSSHPAVFVSALILICQIACSCLGVLTQTCSDQLRLRTRIPVRARSHSQIQCPGSNSRSRLLNLTGFFSSVGGAGRPALAAGADIIWE